MKNGCVYKLLRLPQVAEMLGVSKSTVWLYSRNGTLPKPIKLSPRVTVWRESDIQKLIESLGDNNES